MEMTEDKRNEAITQVKEISKNIFSGKLNILTILFAIFATLKITGQITWSWWWVTAPLWGGFALIFILLILIILILFLVYLISE